MRVTLNDDEVLQLLSILELYNHELYKNIQGQYEADNNRDKSRKVQSIKEATKARQTAAKAQINNAINLMRMESSKITTYSLSKKSECSYNTVKKYKYDEMGVSRW